MTNPAVSEPFHQRYADVRFEWGAVGATALARSSDVLIVVDIFSFTTALDVAVARHAIVYPVAHSDESSRKFAGDIGALLAVDRREISAAEPYSLWPRSLQAIPPGTKLVLPSLNGSSISATAAKERCDVLGGCFRNRSAVARAAVKLGLKVAVIACGERWPDGSLRPAYEDLLGAGAIISALELAGRLPSPEARAASVAFEDARSDLKAVLEHTHSSLELLALGFPDDATIASRVDVSEAVPYLRDGAYRDARNEV